MIQRLTSVMVFLGFLVPMVMGQGHQPVFPELDGFDLELAVRQAYRPTELMEYGEARDTLYKAVEARNDSVYGIYTEHAVYLPPNENPRQAIFRDGAADGINAEHTWPRSKGSRNNLGERDMHHLRPSKVSVNADRANFPFANLRSAEVSTWYYRDLEFTSPPVQEDLYSKLGSEMFEPRDEVKGDIARGMMYFYTVYRAEAVSEDPDFFEIQREALCEWHLEDPVDEWEWERSYKVAEYQEDKPNPFVLDCTLAYRMYCSDFEECDPVISSLETVAQWDVELYPTVASHRITITLPHAPGEELRYAIYSSHGRLMAERSTRRKHTEVDISQLPSGMYFIQIQSKEGRLGAPTKRFVKF